MPYESVIEYDETGKPKRVLIYEVDPETGSVIDIYDIVDIIKYPCIGEDWYGDSEFSECGYDPFIGSYSDEL